MSNEWIKLPPRPNLSNAQHFLLMLLGMISFKILPTGLCMSITVLVIELDQAMTWSRPWTDWFKEWDTWYDMIAGWLAIFIIEIIGNYIK